MTDFEFKREQADVMLDRMQDAGMAARSKPVDDRYPAGSWQVSGSQLFRVPTDREESLSIPMHGTTMIEWCIYADAYPAFESEYVSRPARWQVRVCYRLDGMSGYQYVNLMVPLDLDVHPADLDAICNHLVNNARACIADGIRLGALRGHKLTIGAKA